MESKISGSAWGEESSGSHIIQSPDTSGLRVELLYGDTGLQGYRPVSSEQFENSYGGSEAAGELLVAVEGSDLDEACLDTVRVALEKGEAVFMLDRDYRELGVEAMPEGYSADEHLESYWARVGNERGKYFLIEMS